MSDLDPHAFCDEDRDRLRRERDEALAELARIQEAADIKYSSRPAYLEIGDLKRERDRYKELAQCQCGAQAEYPAHGWTATLCPSCQREALSDG